MGTSRAVYGAHYASNKLKDRVCVCAANASAHLLELTVSHKQITLYFMARWWWSSSRCEPLAFLWSLHLSLSATLRENCASMQIPSLVSSVCIPVVLLPLSTAGFDKRTICSVYESRLFLQVFLSSAPSLKPGLCYNPVLLIIRYFIRWIQEYM